MSFCKALADLPKDAGKMTPNDLARMTGVEGLRFAVLGVPWEDFKSRTSL